LTGSTDPFPGDDGSNGEESDVYIGPDLWKNATPAVACNLPCTLVLPPFPLETPATITWPEYTTSLLSSSEGSIYTKTTTIHVPPFVITEIPFWAVTVASMTVESAIFSPMQSIAPPPIVLTLPGTETPFPLNHTMTSSSTSATITSSTSVSTPAAVQTGIASNCISFYMAVSGDTCYGIAIAHGITLEQFVVSMTRCLSFSPQIGN